MAGLNPSGALKCGGTTYTSIGKNNAIVMDHVQNKLYFNGYEVSPPANTPNPNTNSYTVAYDYPVSTDPTKDKYIGVLPDDSSATNLNTNIVNNITVRVPFDPNTSGTIKFTKAGTYQFTFTVELNGIPTNQLEVGILAKSDSLVYDSIDKIYLAANNHVKQSIITFAAGGSVKSKVLKFNIYMKLNATIQLFIAGGTADIDKILTTSTLTIKEI
jgi:hypothetical protein